MAIKLFARRPWYDARVDTKSFTYKLSRNNVDQAIAAWGNLTMTTCLIGLQIRAMTIEALRRTIWRQKDVIFRLGIKA
jgi:hypothetical protein